MKHALFALALCPAAAFAQEAPDAAMPVIDIPPPAFVQMAASSNAFEIRSSELAETKATAAPLKEFAAQMITDHTKAGQDLKAAAGDTPVPEDLSPKHAAMMDLLGGAEGAEFDMLYKDMQAVGHAEAVTLFRTFGGQEGNAELLQFARATLPVLEEHKMHIDHLVAQP